MSFDFRRIHAKRGQNWAKSQADRPLLGRPAWYFHSGNVTQLRGSKSGVRPWSNWKHRKASTSIQRLTRQPKITKFQEPTSLENVQEQSKASAKSVAEMGQREAGRPSNCKTNARPTANRLQEVIRATV